MKKYNKSTPIFTLQCYEDRQTTLPIRKADQIPMELMNDKQQDKREFIQKPPPPPPMPFSNGQQNGDQNKPDGNLVKSENHDIIKIPNLRKVGTLNRVPITDYNNKTDMPIKTRNLKDENAEVDSLESYKLKNPINVAPKAPSNYFIKAPNGSTTMKKHARPVSVTIGEYVNNIGRKEPSKLDFLNGNKSDTHRTAIDEPITSRLQSELALTLSRSNLRKKTEALGDGGR